jgi:hypothetical protein
MKLFVSSSRSTLRAIKVTSGEVMFERGFAQRASVAQKGGWLHKKSHVACSLSGLRVSASGRNRASLSFEKRQSEGSISVQPLATPFL